MPANLVTPLADAQMDSVPVVAITGQVARHLIGTDGFQEADISGITMPITKHNFPGEGRRHPEGDREAFHIAESGRPGAVPGRHPERTSCRRRRRFSWPPQIDLPGYRPVTAARQAGA